MHTLPFYTPDRKTTATIRAGINNHKSETPPVRRISCGCCTNGCVCFMHREVPRGQPMQKCAIHSGSGKTEAVYV